MTTATMEPPVAKARKVKGRPSEARPKYVPAKINEEAVRLGKIAASFEGSTLADYVSRVVAEAALRDINAGHAKMMKGPKPSRTEGGE